MAAVAVLALPNVFIGCGQYSSPPALIRVGGTRIDASTIKHWEHTMRLNPPVTGSFVRESYHTQTVDFLISGNRVIKEAARQGILISTGAVKRRSEGRLRELSHTGNIDKALASTGRSIADVEFEVRVALAASKLRGLIFSHVPGATEAEIVAYYNRHHLVPFPQERRVVDLIERSRSRAAAIAVARQLGSGQRFAKQAIHETVERPTPQEEEQDLNGRLMHTVFAAPIHKTVGPVDYFGKWVIFVVRDIDRGPLGSAQGTTEATEHILRARRQVALQAFILQYRREWRTKTYCRDGFVVPDCSESHASLGTVGDPLLDT